MNWCDPSSVKQIAGRAGRLSSNYKVGVVTAWQVMIRTFDAFYNQKHFTVQL